MGNQVQSFMYHDNFVMYPAEGQDTYYDPENKVTLASFEDNIEITGTPNQFLKMSKAINTFLRLTEAYRMGCDDQE